MARMEGIITNNFYVSHQINEMSKFNDMCDVLLVLCGQINCQIDERNGKRRCSTH